MARSCDALGVDKARRLLGGVGHRWRASDEDIRRQNERVRECLRVRAELKEEWGRLADLSPVQLVREWIAFVAIVEVGYDDTGEYYVSELRTREFIAELCRRLPGATADYFEQSVALWDERFRAATTEGSRPFFYFGGAEEPAWWWYRTPRIWPAEWD